MRKVKHWLHIVLSILTSGLWLPVYLILVATTEMFNRGYREGKAAGRVARQNEIDAAEFEKKVHGPEGFDPVKFYGDSEPPKTFSGLGFSHIDAQGRRVLYDAYGSVRFGCTAAPVVPFDESRAQSRVDRFAELSERVRTVGLDDYERREFNQLRAELIKP